MCGYCGGPLTRTAGGDWRCEPCQPALREIRTLEQWASWQARMWRDRQRRRGQGRLF